eukprot:CAMPEP_0201488810 /NCGR_PEP_ID=MMETSP0151_2-20130828/19457_1 /ASSEMBLY_ACC=CAM_ASM_000257 /TAXON_ID=200890 /ORGANISM="Paramoeba atlantica, Strain 621/1 / CCAP 1560/9" /LENGTH=398 /DNA_ID=CAMNT_0047874171 /DNA_START=29 /DNA_END=1225 /DNA_ORIENTATION=+
MGNWFDAAQRERLEKYFKTWDGETLKPEDTLALQQETGLTKLQIRGWLRNRKIRGAYKGRVIHQENQVRALEWVFTNYSEYLNHEMAEKIANLLRMTSSQVKKWFESRRRRDAPAAILRRGQCSNLEEWKRTLKLLQQIVNEEQAAARVSLGHPAAGCSRNPPRPSSASALPLPSTARYSLTPPIKGNEKTFGSPPPPKLATTPTPTSSSTFTIVPPRKDSVSPAAAFIPSAANEMCFARNYPHHLSGVTDLHRNHHHSSSMMMATPSLYSPPQQQQFAKQQQQQQLFCDYSSQFSSPSSSSPFFAPLPSAAPGPSLAHLSALSVHLQEQQEQQQKQQQQQEKPQQQQQQQQEKAQQLQKALEQQRRTSQSPEASDSLLRASLPPLHSLLQQSIRQEA